MVGMDGMGGMNMPNAQITGMMFGPNMNMDNKN